MPANAFEVEHHPGDDHCAYHAIRSGLIAVGVTPVPAVRHAVHLAALWDSPRQLPCCERFGLASTQSKHSTLHDLSHVLDARVHLTRVLEAAGAAGRESARLEYAEARWQRLEADGPTLRRCCVLAAT